MGTTQKLGSELEARDAIASYAHWYHRIELAPGITTPGINDTASSLALLDLPEDLSGKTVLDIGTRDGFFAFECERRGADVVAVDYLPADATGFSIAARLLGSKIRYLQENIYRLDRRTLGTFDIVLMLGLLYHLRDPLGALDIVRELCDGVVYIETHVCDDHIALPDGSFTSLAEIDPRLQQMPIMQFCAGSLLNSDPTNFWAPNTICVDRLLGEASFDVEATTRAGDRSVFRARSTENGLLSYYRDIARGTALPSV